VGILTATSAEAPKTPSSTPLTPPASSAPRKYSYDKGVNKNSIIRIRGKPTTIIIADESLNDVTDVPEDMELHIVNGANIDTMTRLLKNKWMGGLNESTKNIIITAGKNNTTREDPVKNTCSLWTQINASRAYPHVFFLASNASGTGKINDNARKAVGKNFIPRPAQVSGSLTSQQQNTHTTLFEHIRKHLN